MDEIYLIKYSVLHLVSKENKKTAERRKKGLPSYMLKNKLNMVLWKAPPQTYYRPFRVRIVIKRNRNSKARFTVWWCYSSSRVRNDCNFERHLGSIKNAKVIKNDLTKE